MTETLLSSSNILLFGRRLDDLKIVEAEKVEKVRLVTGENVDLTGLDPVDGVKPATNDRILVRKQDTPSENGIYKAQSGSWTPDNGELAQGNVVKASDDGETRGKSKWIVTSNSPFRFERFRRNKMRKGANMLLEDQLADGELARIYGFSWDGIYYDLPRPTIFLVHGEGENAVGTVGTPHAPRGPLDPSVTGLAAADFQFAHQLKVWSYDKADYTIRMDVETGMFEDVLLAAFFGGDGYGVSGAKVSGAKVSGAKLSGARVSGAKVSGAKLWGGRGDAGD
jgi:hypothetical protein